MEMHSSQTCLIAVAQDLHSIVFGIGKDNLKVLPYLSIEILMFLKHVKNNRGMD